MHNGPRGKDTTNEKAKDFKSAMLRLFSELKEYRKLAYLGLIMAALGSILSIFAPNHLSSLTDEIQAGLIVNSDNLTTITTSVTETLEANIVDYLNISMDESTIAEVMMSKEISEDEKASFQTFLNNLQTSKGNIDYETFLGFSDNLLQILLKDSTYKGVPVSKEEKMSFLNGLKNNEFHLTEEVQNVFFEPLDVDGVTISSKDQLDFLNVASTLTTEDTSTSLYQKIDTMPESVRLVVEPFMDMDEIWNIATFLITLYLISALCTYIEFISMTHVANKFANRLRDNISKKINRLPLKYFDAHQSGDTLSRVTNDVDMIAQSMNQSLSTFVSAVTLFVGTTIMMFYTNWILALTAIGSSILGFIFMFLVLGKSQKYFVSRQIELGNLNSHIEEVYSG